MKQIAACLLIAAGIGGAGYCADKALRTPGDLVFLSVNADMSDLTPDFIPDWHFKEPHFRKLLLWILPGNGELAMRTRELFLQGCFFTISCLTLLFLLSIAVHFPLGRVLFAVFVSGICLSRRVLRAVQSGPVSVAMERKSCDRFGAHSPPEPTIRDFLTETKK